MMPNRAPLQAHGWYFATWPQAQVVERLHCDSVKEIGPFRRSRQWKKVRLGEFD